MPRFKTAVDYVKRHCAVQAACDGELISERKKDQSMCSKCERAIARRNKPAKLKGANYKEGPECRRR